MLQERHIKLISQTFNVNEEWLKSGIDPIFKEEKNDNLEKVFQEYDLSPFMQDIVIRYLDLPKHLQELFEKFIKVISNSKKTLFTNYILYYFISKCKKLQSY